MAWWTAASVIKGREYKSPYDWCQLNNHQGAIGVSVCAACEIMNIPRSGLIGVKLAVVRKFVREKTNGKEQEEMREGRGSPR